MSEIINEVQEEQAKQVAIEDLNVIELKALAYDLVIEANQRQTILMKVNELIKTKLDIQK